MNNKKAEESLIRLALMVENTSDLTSIADLNGNLLYLNQAGKKMLGLDENTDISKLKIADFHPAWALKIVQEEGIPEALKTGAWRGETALLCRNGQEIPVSQVIITHKNNGGEVDLLATIIRDITDRKEIERKLVEKEQLLNEAQAIAGLGVYKTDFTKNRWESSEILDEIFGIDKDFVRSVKGWALLIHPDDRKMMEDYLQNEVIGKCLNFDKEYRIIQKNSGMQRWVHGLGKMTFDKQNSPLTMVGIIQDITERKKAEEAVKESQLMLQNVINLLPVRIFWKDINLKYLGSNKAFALDAGKKSPEELIGKDDFQMGWKEQADIYRSDDMKVINSGESKLDYEEAQTTPAGDKIWLNTNKVPLRDNSGKIIGVLGTYIDITERKKAEENLMLKNQELEKLNQLMVGRELKMTELKEALRQAQDEKLKGEEN